VTCAGACPPVQTRVFQDSLMSTTGNSVRVRLFQGIPNLPADRWVLQSIDAGDVIRRTRDMKRTRQAVALKGRKTVCAALRRNN